MYSKYTPKKSGHSSISVSCEMGDSRLLGRYRYQRTLIQVMDGRRGEVPWLNEIPRGSPGPKSLRVGQAGRMPMSQAIKQPGIKSSPWHSNRRHHARWPPREHHPVGRHPRSCPWELGHHGMRHPSHPAHLLSLELSFKPCLAVLLALSKSNIQWLPAWRGLRGRVELGTGG